MFRTIIKICNGKAGQKFSDKLRKTFLHEVTGFSGNQLSINEIGEKLSIFVSKYLKNQIFSRLYCK